MTAKQVFPLLWPHGMMMKFEFILSSLSRALSLSSDVKSGGLSLTELSIPPVNCVAMSAYFKQHLAWIFTLCVVFWDYSHYVYVSIYIGYMHTIYLYRIYLSKISITLNQIACFSRGIWQPCENRTFINLSVDCAVMRIFSSSYIHVHVISL